MMDPDLPRTTVFRRVAGSHPERTSPSRSQRAGPLVSWDMDRAQLPDPSGLSEADLRVRFTPFRCPSCSSFLDRSVAGLRCPRCESPLPTAAQVRRSCFEAALERPAPAGILSKLRDTPPWGFLVLGAAVAISFGVALVLGLTRWGWTTSLAVTAAGVQLGLATVVASALRWSMLARQRAHARLLARMVQGRSGGAEDLRRWLLLCWPGIRPMDAVLGSRGPVVTGACRGIPFLVELPSVVPAFRGRVLVGAELDRVSKRRLTETRLQAALESLSAQGWDVELGEDGGLIASSIRPTNLEAWPAVIVALSELVRRAQRAEWTASPPPRSPHLPKTMLLG